MYLIYLSASLKPSMGAFPDPPITAAEIARDLDSQRQLLRWCRARACGDYRRHLHFLSCLRSFL